MEKSKNFYALIFRIYWFLSLYFQRNFNGIVAFTDVQAFNICNCFQCQLLRTAIWKCDIRRYISDYLSSNISIFRDFHLVSVCLVASKELRDRGDHQHDLGVRTKGLHLYWASEWGRHLHGVEIILSSHHNNSTLKLRARSLAAFRVTLQLKARNILLDWLTD